MATVNFLSVYTRTPDGARIILHAGDTVPALAEGELEKLVAQGAVTEDPKPTRKGSAE